MRTTRRKNTFATSRIILASQSYSRQRLISLAGIEAEILPSEFDEYAVHLVDFPNKSEYVSAIAAGKLLDITDRLETLEDTYIIGGDLVVFVDDQPFFKPQTITQAREYIELLAGKKHEELCATAFWSPQFGLEIKTESVWVTVPKLTEMEIQEYVEIARPLEKAAGFSIVALQRILRHHKQPATAKVEGSMSALLGISLPALETFFTKAGLSFPVPAHQIEHQLSNEILTKEFAK